MPTASASFRASVQRWLSHRPRPTSDGVVRGGLRSAEFGYPGDTHGQIDCWVYQRRNSRLELLFGFHHNFTRNDLICKVVAAGQSVPPGVGASVQLNADRSVRAMAPQTWQLTHHGVVTVGQAISRARLAAIIAVVASAASSALGGIGHPLAWPVLLGSTSDIAALIDRLYLYAFCVEQAKRNIRGEKPFPGPW